LYLYQRERQFGRSLYADRRNGLRGRLYLPPDQ
jgi:hypothetical protein